MRMIKLIVAFRYILQNYGCVKWPSLLKQNTCSDHLVEYREQKTEALLKVLTFISLMRSRRYI